jgi:hypothetical protein
VLERDPGRALALARANWQVQREPWDTRLLREAEAAVAAKGGAVMRLLGVDLPAFRPPLPAGVEGGP